MTRWTATIPQVLHHRAGREFSARHDQEPQALALVPLRRTHAGDWTLTDPIGDPVQPDSRNWVGTAKTRRPGQAAGGPMPIGAQWLWTARVDHFLPDPPSPWAAFVLWLLRDQPGGTLYRRIEPVAFGTGVAAATGPTVQASQNDDDAPLRAAIQRAVGDREKFKALLTAALLTWP
ncbi:hypothetical protein [Azohydromonas sediminis]|uniref:hypothetical protein n=1 Tax=Azohydromonas sediminis TaxID=2259674 RepID=UPI000E64B817|nr:hypothetical protein [Azohydromonas sediminis]